MNTTEQIGKGLVALGFKTGWVVCGDVITLWEHDVPQPSMEKILQAGAKAQTDVVAASASGRAKLAALGLTNDEIKALLGA